MKTLLTMSRLSYFGLALSFCLPRVGLCDIWDLTRSSILKNPSQCSYEKTIKYLELLTPSSNISVDSESEDTILIANGSIVVNPESIRSYRDPSDYREKKDPEFEFRFSDCLGIKEEQEVEAESKTPPEKVSIALDLTPSHKYFIDRKIGEFMYDDFIRALQDELRNSLISKGFSVDIIRPKMSSINAEAINTMNSCAPTIVLSTQFNDDKQDDMTVFCAGGILKSEFTNERQRARFIQSALTSKHVCSAELGACLMETISEQLNVKPLDWQKASFEGNAIPVSCSTEGLKCVEKLENREGCFNGIAMRNLIHNGIFANAVVILFPDMKWVMEQVKPGEEMEWISRYVNAITDGVQKFLGSSPQVL